MERPLPPSNRLHGSNRGQWCHRRGSSGRTGLYHSYLGLTPHEPLHKKESRCRTEGSQGWLPCPSHRPYRLEPDGRSLVRPPKVYEAVSLCLPEGFELSCAVCPPSPKPLSNPRS